MNNNQKIINYYEQNKQFNLKTLNTKLKTAQIIIISTTTKRMFLQIDNESGVILERAQFNEQILRELKSDRSYQMENYAFYKS
ncbi:hypothetical protein [Chryseobacterium sp. 2987]|uniref:hypothetical protein n=1 Tax=Chryseobacterium sp. 2987 TaxID=2817767 RepID=UPI0028639D8E|nr:hypothetical protein [Chryseobacterium sp. 2987]MDR6922055.1 galactitol-specific phosphotransferase system IIB component [Chryseobacterium sp. 2987]